MTWQIFQALMSSRDKHGWQKFNTKFMNPMLPYPNLSAVIHLSSRKLNAKRTMLQAKDIKEEGGK